MTPKLPTAALLLALVAPPQALAQDFLLNLFGLGDRSAERAPSQRSGVSRERLSPSHASSRRKRHDAKKTGAFPAKPQQPQAPASPEPPPAPYDPQLRRLAEILGGLSYLRDLCGDRDGDDWRRMMASLREAEAPAGLRRQRLTAAFNRGFSSYELTYRACTPNARLIIERYLSEAHGLAQEISARYGNP
jgi:uncharacterized protein (TIGR02301 family)